MVAGLPEKICDANKKQYVDCRGEMMLIPTFPKESAVKKFYDEKSEYLTPIGAEFKLSTRYMGDKVRKICGTCDLLFYEEDPFFGEDQFVLADWKTNASLTNDYKRKKLKKQKHTPNTPHYAYVEDFKTYVERTYKKMDKFK